MCNMYCCCPACFVSNTKARVIMDCYKFMLTLYYMFKHVLKCFCIYCYIIAILLKLITIQPDSMPVNLDRKTSL